MIRNFLLTDSDWTQMPDAVIDTDTKAMWTKYRAKLRSIPQDYDGQDADDVKFPMNPLYYKIWIEQVDVNNNKINEGEYLETMFQFGKFDKNTYGEYARRIVMTIASNYKIKNPDEIFSSKELLDIPDSEYPTTQSELDALLEKIKNNNV